MLLLQFSAGDKEAFATLYRFYQPVLMHILQPFRDIEDPEEVIQDIFYKLWAKKEIVAGLQSFKGYLYRMAKNRILDIKKSREALLRHETGYATIQPRQSTHIEETLIYKELHQYAIQAIEQLPPKQQEIFTLSVIRELSREEVATLLGISLSVVDKQLYLARKAVRSRILQQATPPPDS